MVAAAAPAVCGTEVDMTATQQALATTANPGAGFVP